MTSRVEKSDFDMNVVDEKEAAKAANSETYYNKIKMKLKNNVEADKQLEKQRIQEKRLKKKRQRRDMQGKYDEDDYGDEAHGVQLATVSDSPSEAVSE